MIKTSTATRRTLGKASRVTLGGQVGVIEPRGLFLAGIGLRAA